MYNYYKTLIRVAIIASFIAIVSSYGESDADGNPVWQEREAHIIVNAMRIDPVKYKSLLFTPSFGAPADNVLNTDVYPAVPPIFFQLDVCRAARMHSATNNCFTHSNCGNSSSSGERIQKFAGVCNAYSGENIAAGTNYDMGIESVNYLMCEVSKLPCNPDGTKDGHRSNMMSGNYIAAGLGVAYNKASTYSWYWTQDFTSCETNLPIGSPVHSGSHTFVKDKIIYMADFYDTNSTAVVPSSAKIYFDDGSSFDMNVEFGAPGRGMYTYRPNSYIPCQQYYFEFKTASATYRYPFTGRLSTAVTSSSACESWVDSKGINSANSIIPSMLAVILGLVALLL
eukprot:gene13671-16099_t